MAHPFIPGASPLVDDLDTVRRLEDAGAAAITMHSLFEEQLAAEQMAAHRFLDGPSNSFAEATDWFPSTGDFKLGPDAYLEQIRKIREAVKLPVIGSLNGVTVGGWLDYAKKIEQAGASAIELNMYSLPSDASMDAQSIEQQQLDIVRTLKKALHIPIAVKLSPFYSSLPSFVRVLEKEGIEGLVLFNRFYQPDIDIETLQLDRVLQLSDRTDLLLRIRWLAILSARSRLSFAASGGIHEAADGIKALMAGASVLQLVTTLLRHGPKRLAELRLALVQWMEKHEYESVTQLVGSMNLVRCPDPSSYERANYVKLLMSWHDAAKR